MKSFWVFPVSAEQINKSKVFGFKQKKENIYPRNLAIKQEDEIDSKHPNH